VPEVGVDAVGEGDVDDAILAGKGHGRFGAIAGEGEEPFAGTTGKQNAKSISHISITPELGLTDNYELRESDAQSDSGVTEKRESTMRD
jgi:hypothetical protein